ncbi:MAG: phosphoribosylamine--glycine ligase [Verrucomicrobiae bacterium]
MDILIIGSGGREHALAWKIARSPRAGKIFCAPGNAGTAALGENVAISADDIPALVAFAKSRSIGLTVVGPDDSLAAGISEAFEAAGLKIFGPSSSAARLESSKAFAKDFMRRHGIPTADYREFNDSMAAHEWCRTARYPLVIKADGLALGKGVLIAETPAAAAQAIYRCMDAAVFGEAGKRIVIEEFLTGAECSLHALVDGSSYLLLPDCRDHKRALDGDRGPNTGGMGTICPSGSLDEALRARLRSEVLDRFLAGIQADGIAFRGMLFPGIMLTADGPKVLEFNCRWGDPETQVLVRRLGSDLLDLLEACADGCLASQSPQWPDGAAACVILASGGYPGTYEKGIPIAGIEAAEALPDVVVFHAGTKTSASGGVVTNGGRVLGVTATGRNLAEARARAYEAAGRVSFSRMQRRNDIGASPSVEGESHPSFFLAAGLEPA